MKKIKTLFAPLILALFLSTQVFANMEAFPEAEKGMTRFVLELPAQNDESDFKVELVVGRTLLTDEHNRYFFVGAIEEVDIEGWGYTRYVVNELGPMAGTLMAVDPNTPKVERFISLGGEPYLIRYNSRLPIVVYVPEGTEVKYRIWQADKEFSAVREG